MVNVVPFEPSHLDDFKFQKMQAYLSSQITPELAVNIAREGEAFTAESEDKILACAGIFPMWQGRYIAWAYISRYAIRHMVGVHRAVLSFLDNCSASRVEATVDEGFEAGHKWMKMLGFSLETPFPMRNYRPGGGNSFLYARVKSCRE